MNPETDEKNLHPELKDLAAQIMANCHRSDARFAGSFSLCGLLLRLRDYCKWESGTPVWQEMESPDVLEWIEKRENLWETIADDILPLVWRGREVDPFDIETINRDLEAFGFYYGAGYGAFLKPTFLMGRVERKQILDGHPVFYFGRETVRDLFTVPAQARDGVILARKRPLAAYLWDTALHAEKNRRKGIDLALSVYGLGRPGTSENPDEWGRRFEKMLDREIDAFVWHELGEMADRELPPDVWRTVIGNNPHSRLELMARTLKDLLADTGESGRLSLIIRNGRIAALGIYTALTDGLAAVLFPEIFNAFERFLKLKDWRIIEDARLTVRHRISGMANTLAAMVKEAAGRDDWLVNSVEQHFYKPLGL